MVPDSDPASYRGASRVYVRFAPDASPGYSLMSILLLASLTRSQPVLGVASCIRKSNDAVFFPPCGPPVTMGATLFHPPRGPWT